MKSATQISRAALGLTDGGKPDQAIGRPPGSILQGRSTVDRRAHNAEAVGSTPSPASNSRGQNPLVVEAGQHAGVGSGARVTASLPAAAWTFLLNEWIRQLLNALLRPMFIRVRLAKLEETAEGTARAERYQRLFDRLLFSCDCHPYSVILDRWGLWILDNQEMRDFESTIGLEEDYA